MSRAITTRSPRPTASALLAALVCLGVGACGSSSSGSSSSSASTPAAAKTTAEATPTPTTTTTSTTPASTTPASTTPAKTSPTSEGPTIKTHSQYLAALECMRHNGIKLPPFDQLRTYKITNTQQFDAVWKKCRYIVIDGHAPGSSGGESSGGSG
jgi:hypothetical protein